MTNKFYWEPQHLNMKKVIGIVVIILIVILGSIFGILSKIRKIEKKEETQNYNKNTIINKTSIFYSNDNSISVELLNSYNLKKFDSDYLLELRSDDNLNIFIDSQPAIENKTLSDIINKEKENYISNFENSSNISEIKEISINDNQIYTYSFHYLDTSLNATFYLQVMWLQINDKYYIIDIEFPLDKLTFFTNVATSILYSFKIN